MIKKFLLLGSSALVSQAALANENIQSVIDAFTNCDSSFFYQLKTNATDFDGITDLVIKDDIAYIPVDDMTSNEGYTRYFTQPIEYRGLTITGYQNIYIETPFLGKYYYWGFIVGGSIDDVKQSLNQLPWQQYNVTSYVANSLIYDRQNKEAGWKNYPYVIDGVIPRSFTVEKAIYVEPINETQVHLVCSIQGDLDRPLLYSIHPDIEDFDQALDAKRLAALEAIKNKQKLEAEQQNDNIQSDVESTTGDNEHSEEN